MICLKNKTCAFLVAACAIVLQCAQFRGASAEQLVTLHGEKIAVEAENRDGRLRERYLAARDGQWVETASADQGGSLGPVLVMAEPDLPMSGSVTTISLIDGALVEAMTAGQSRVVRSLKIVGDGSWLKVVTRLEPAGGAALYRFADRFKFSRKPDWTYAPSVGGFIPDAQYKAPLILTQADQLAFGIVPDVSVLDREKLQRCNHALDLDVPGGPTLAVGWMPARLAYHSVYAPDPKRTWKTESPLENVYFLFVSATAKPHEAYRRAVRFHWSQFGEPAQAHAAVQQQGTCARYRDLKLWDDWRATVWEKESKAMWLTVPFADGMKGGGVLTLRWGPGPSIYLSAWFNTLRTSYGMALYARRTGNHELEQLAEQTVTLALKAPGRDGAFKCIAVPGGRGKPTIWAAGDGSLGSTKDGFLGYDMCWTGYWLLRWRVAELSRGDDILRRCQELAEFMVARQAADGMLPTRFAENGSVQEELSRQVKAETGPVVLFLLELYRQDKNPRWSHSARKGIEFLEQQVIPQRQWYDFETFFSCSPRGPNFDARSGQWPANDLALSQTVAAYLAAYRATGEARYLAGGERLLDYLLLFQQCWTNPVIEDLSCPTMLLGGFTTQNSDAEWSDARQSQCGDMLLDYYAATGKVEYLERGVAALRAQFPISPSENWAHQGYGKKAAVSSFHWGSGSGLAGVEMYEQTLHDAIVDLGAGRAVGVNGLDVAECTVRGGEVRVKFDSPFVWSHDPLVGFHRGESARKYTVYLNGRLAGAGTGAELEMKTMSVAARPGPPLPERIGP